LAQYIVLSTTNNRRNLAKKNNGVKTYSSLRPLYPPGILPQRAATLWDQFSNRLKPFQPLAESDGALDAARPAGAHPIFQAGLQAVPVLSVAPTDKNVHSLHFC